MGPVIAILLLLPWLLAGCPQPSASVMERPVLAAGPDSVADSHEGRLQEGRRGRPLPPDRRFLAAAEEITTFFSPGSEAECGALWGEASSTWTIRCGDQELGTVPKRPDFSDYFELLASWAERAGSVQPDAIDFGAPTPSLERVDSEFARLTPGSLISSLRLLDTLWRQGGRHPVLLQRAARSMVLLSLQSGGLDEATDRVAARAVALTVLAGGGLALQNVEAEEALLAHQLGYRKRALAAASQLPAGHPVQLFLQGSLEELRETAETGTDAPLARFLYLQRLAEEPLPKDWERWAARYFSDLPTALPVLYSRPPGAALGIDDASVWERTLDLVQVESARAAGELNASLERALPEGPATAAEWRMGDLRSLLWRGGIPSIGEFEAMLSRLHDLYPGPFLDSRTLRAHFRGFFYAAVYGLAQQALAEGACNSVFNLEAHMSGEARQGEWAQGFQSWFQAQLQASLSPQRRDAFDVFSLVPRGTDGLAEAFEAAAARLPEDNPSLQEIVRRFDERLDSRPSHLPLKCRMQSVLMLKALARGDRQEASGLLAESARFGCSQDEVSYLQQSRRDDSM